ncbi:MAG: peptide chain release factor 2 [Verrucomicrobiota bacterium]
MSTESTTTEMSDLRSRLGALRRYLDVEALSDRLETLEAVMNDGNFWDDREAAQKTIAEANSIKARLVPLREVMQKVEDLGVLEELVAEDPSEANQKELAAEQAEVETLLGRLEIRILLSGENDSSNAIISLHAGAGGTEACDWANMLLRMYQRYCERSGFKVELLDLEQGEEAGVKSATLTISGEYAYGKLKNEHGVHRLVRISPFNSAGKRQTSFASLDVVPEVDDNIEIEIPESDLRVDIFRSGGPGGQGVNTTDSAVRLVHLPTSLIVQCQNERSQHKNKASALKVLRSRLYELEMDKKRAEAEKHYGEKGEIGWGRQIRSYVLQPYQMVKDLRTGEQSGDVQGVLDGDLEAFIEAKLKGKKRTDTDSDEE